MASDQDEIVDLTGFDDDDDDDDADGQDSYDRRALLFPIITRVVDALGGHEGDKYRLGDEALSCLKDLKKLWRKDDDDDERTVARIFHETRVLPNDLIPILMFTAGKGLVEDKHAIACADLMTAMTWPIDMAEELKELDDELDKGTDYTQLLRSHLEYKVALLKPGVLQALIGIMLPPLAKTPRARTQRDGQIVNVVLHLIRNLAFIRDLHLNADKSSDSAELSAMQNKLVLVMHEVHALRLLLTVAANADGDKLFDSWNTLVLEIVYLLLRGVKPAELAMDQEKQPGANLQRLLKVEETRRRDIARNATSRHSRFGTTIAITLNPNKKTPSESEGANIPSSSTSARPLVLHRQQAVNQAAGALLDLGKKQKGRKGLTVDELTRDDNFSLEARRVLQQWACDFLEECFNSFVSTLIKDIRSERSKITEKDHLRLLYVSKWFLEFFLASRSKADVGTGENGSKWSFGLVAQVTEREWIGWAFKRMREAVDEKPKLWTELQAGIDCLTQLLLLLDAMASSTSKPVPEGGTGEEDDVDLPEQAAVLQQQMIYNGEILDLALESLRAYRPGTQSLKYLDASVGFTWALIRMVERMHKRNASGVQALVRQKKVKKRKKKAKKGVPEEGTTVVAAEANGEGNNHMGSVPGDENDSEDEDDGDESETEIRETMFTFEAFEMKLANTEIANTLLTYLARYKEFENSECMRRVVSLLHRQAVRAKAEGLFFNVSTLDLFQTILANQKSLPHQQPYKDLIALLNFILRQFFKALEKDSFLAIEAFFPKNRGNWKQYSSWEPDNKPERRSKHDEGGDIGGKSVASKNKFPSEVRVKKGYSWSDQLGIAVAALTEAGKEGLVQWTKETLALVIAQRQGIIEEIDGTESMPDDSNEDQAKLLSGNKPSDDALTKITEYVIPYVNDEQAHAAGRNPELKLLFRLCKFSTRNDDGDEVEWYIPASVPVSDLQSTLVVINQFIVNPINLDGKNASQLLSKSKATRPRRRRRVSTSFSDDEAILSDDEPERRRKEKKNKESKQYKSAQFIEDSDAEYGDIEAFFEKEKLLREKAIAAAAKACITDRPVGMRATGTKKRRRRNGEEGKGSKRRRGETSPQEGRDLLFNHSPDSDADNSNAPSEVEVELQPSPPKPRPLAKHRRVPPDSDAISVQSSPQSKPSEVVSRRRTKVLLLSEDEDE